MLHLVDAASGELRRDIAGRPLGKHQQFDGTGCCRITQAATHHRLVVLLVVQHRAELMILETQLFEEATCRTAIVERADDRDVMRGDEMRLIDAVADHGQHACVIERRSHLEVLVYMPEIGRAGEAILDQIADLIHRAFRRILAAQILQANIFIEQVAHGQTRAVLMDAALKTSACLDAVLDGMLGPVDVFEPIPEMVQFAILEIGAHHRDAAELLNEIASLDMIGVEFAVGFAVGNQVAKLRGVGQHKDVGVEDGPSESLKGTIAVVVAGRDAVEQWAGLFHHADAAQQFVRDAGAGRDQMMRLRDIKGLLRENARHLINEQVPEFLVAVGQAKQYLMRHDDDLALMRGSAFKMGLDARRHVVTRAARKEQRGCRAGFHADDRSGGFLHELLRRLRDHDLVVCCGALRRPAGKFIGLA